ncbi:ABC transporter permease [bacterium]|nr:ABC transporter permease [bacterium]
MISFIGSCIQNLISCCKYLFGKQVKIKEIINQAATFSFDSLPISLAIVMIAAAVIALQVSKQFLMTGAEDYVGGSIAIVLIRELAPGFAALAISARAGTAICAEIANMKVTEQVDAIKTMNVDPVGYYFTPKIISAAITTPMVVLLAEVCGIVAGMIIANNAIGLHFNRYMNTVWLWLNTKDIYISLLKASIFGILITTVTATQGYKTTGGAVDVGNAVTQGAIKATVFILVTDFIINLIFYL